ncbi:MAG: 50S ribosomal protein L13 [Oligoflexales bacterium]
MKTVSVKAADFDREDFAGKRKWVVVDAAGQTLGRLSTDVARVLRGKHKPEFAPHIDCGDHVIVTNASKIVLTGKKLSNKMYYRHSGYIGGLKATTAGEKLAKNPEEVVTLEVRGMLPKNKLSRQILKHLRVYAGADHEQGAQSPEPMPNRLAVQS